MDQAKLRAKVERMAVYVALALADATKHVEKMKDYKDKDEVKVELLRQAGACKIPAENVDTWVEAAHSQHLANLSL